jgi:uncharacterized protein YjbJ (UPF0337 family)
MIGGNDCSTFARWGVATDCFNLLFNVGGALFILINIAFDARSRSRYKETVMDWNRIEGNWKQLTGKIKEQWGRLTDDDLDKISGKREQLEGKIQERYGTTKDAARRSIDEWLDEKMSKPPGPPT